MFKQIEIWAHDRNLILGSTPQAQFLKLSEELGEVAACIAKQKPLCETQSEIGDMLVVLTIIAAQHNLSIEECAYAAYMKIKDRKGRMENGVFIKEGD